MAFSLDLYIPLLLLVLHYSDSNKVCPPSYEMIGESCYRQSENGRTWEDAREACKQDGGDLAIILDSSTNEAIPDFWSSSWIGLKHQATSFSPEWQWLNGQALTYSLWYPGEPNDDTRGGLDCAHYWNLGSRWDWNDVYCGREAKYVCEHDFEGCPDDFHSQNGGCYKVSDDSKSWEDAREECKRQGGDLALVQDDVAHYTIKGLLEAGTFYYIGLRENPYTGWRWVNDAQLNYQPWHDDDRTNVMENESCVTWNTRGWQHMNCNKVSLYICQTRMIPAKKTTPTTTSTIATTSTISSTSTTTTPTTTNNPTTTTTNTPTTTSTTTTTTSTTPTTTTPTTTTPTTTTPTTTTTTTTTPTTTTTSAAPTTPPPPDPTPVTRDSMEFLRNMSLPQNKSQPSNKMCPCRCQTFDPTPSPEVLGKILLKIKQELYVHPEKLSSKRNKKISAKDERTESRAIGYFSIFLCTIPICLLVALDVMRVSKFFMKT